jgi:hypothetical protein
MSKALEPAIQNGTLFADPIRASSHVDCIKRPKTRLHPTDTPKRQFDACNAGAIQTRHWQCCER